MAEEDLDNIDGNEEKKKSTSPARRSRVETRKAQKLGEESVWHIEKYPRNSHPWGHITML